MNARQRRRYHRAVERARKEPNHREWVDYDTDGSAELPHESWVDVFNQWTQSPETQQRPIFALSRVCRMFEMLLMRTNLVTCPANCFVTATSMQPEILGYHIFTVHAYCMYKWPEKLQTRERLVKFTPFNITSGWDKKDYRKSMLGNGEYIDLVERRKLGGKSVSFKAVVDDEDRRTLYFFDDPDFIPEKTLRLDSYAWKGPGGNSENFFGNPGGLEKIEKEKKKKRNKRTQISFVFNEEVGIWEKK